MPKGDEWTVIEWNVADSDMLGATIVCPHCPRNTAGLHRCTDDTEPNGCSGSGQMHMPYRVGELFIRENGDLFDLRGEPEDAGDETQSEFTQALNWEPPGGFGGHNDG